MNMQITLDQLSQLKLDGMARVYQAVLGLPVQNQPTLIIPDKLYHPFRGKVYHLFQDELVSQKCIFY